MFARITLLSIYNPVFIIHSSIKVSPLGKRRTCEERAAIGSLKPRELNAGHADRRC